jgi:hypothetical protein
MLRHWPELVGGTLLQELALAPQHADMGAEELVRRTDQEVAVPGLNVNRSVRGVMDGIQKDPGARLMCQRVIVRTSLTVPTAFEAQVTATSRVRSLSCRRRSSRSSVQSSGWMSM